MRSASILTVAILMKSIDNDTNKSTDSILTNQIQQQEPMIIDLENESMSPPILVSNNHIKKTDQKIPNVSSKLRSSKKNNKRRATEYLVQWEKEAEVFYRTMNRNSLGELQEVSKCWLRKKVDENGKITLGCFLCNTHGMVNNANGQINLRATYDYSVLALNKIKAHALHDEKHIEAQKLELDKKSKSQPDWEATQLKTRFHQCNYTSQWFNENHPWDSHSEGNDIERFPLIRAKYPSIFEINRWTGLFQIRNASYQQITDKTMLIENYTEINDGFICHAINGKQCIDYEIRFCLEYNPCSVSAYPPDENHIVGGSEARPHSLPWHVSIQYEERHICAGTLIDDRHILTSAHCFQQSLIHIPYSVVLGPHYLSNSTRRITIDRFIFHFDYNNKTGEDDIGLIRLSERIESFSNNIKPACLARSFKEPQKSNPLIVAGWRTVQNNTWSVTNTNELRQTILTITDECSDVYKKYNFQKQICAGTEDSRRDLCQGDNGSGLFEKQKYDVDRWILIGIVSYGCEYAPQGYPGVYIRISAYYDWIQNTIEQMNK